MQEPVQVVLHIVTPHNTAVGHLSWDFLKAPFPKAVHDERPAIQYIHELPDWIVSFSLFALQP